MIHRAITNHMEQFVLFACRITGLDSDLRDNRLLYITLREFMLDFCFLLLYNAPNT